MPSHMQELKHQAAVGERIATVEKKRARKYLPLRVGSITLEGNIPAKIFDYNEDSVFLRFAGGSHAVVSREALAGRFRYAKEGVHDAE